MPALHDDRRAVPQTVPFGVLGVDVEEVGRAEREAGDQAPRRVMLPEL
ncbi:hypothetical protein [Streptomyces fradiae]|nr:hypothetical protein [Streptomyces fradiae]WOI61325.1 hypothetical protein RYQ63_16235 [Streptomyces fradiae]